MVMLLHDVPAVLNSEVRELDVIAAGKTGESGCEEREVEGPVAMLSSLLESAVR
jgi:hypothetical protein